jgi:hypothetical protein
LKWVNYISYMIIWYRLRLGKIWQCCFGLEKLPLGSKCSVSCRWLLLTRSWLSSPEGPLALRRMASTRVRNERVRWTCQQTAIFRRVCLCFSIVLEGPGFISHLWETVNGDVCSCVNSLYAKWVCIFYSPGRCETRRHCVPKRSRGANCWKRAKILNWFWEYFFRVNCCR